MTKTTKVDVNTKTGSPKASAGPSKIFAELSGSIAADAGGGVLLDVHLTDPSVLVDPTLISVKDGTPNPDGSPTMFLENHIKSTIQIQLPNDANRIANTKVYFASLDKSGVLVPFKDVRKVGPDSIPLEVTIYSDELQIGINHIKLVFEQNGITKQIDTDIRFIPKQKLRPLLVTKQFLPVPKFKYEIKNTCTRLTVGDAITVTIGEDETSSLSHVLTTKTLKAEDINLVSDVEAIASVNGVVPNNIDSIIAGMTLANTKLFVSVNSSDDNDDITEQLGSSRDPNLLLDVEDVIRVPSLANPDGSNDIYTEDVLKTDIRAMYPLDLIRDEDKTTTGLALPVQGDKDHIIPISNFKKIGSDPTDKDFIVPTDVLKRGHNDLLIFISHGDVTITHPFAMSFQPNQFGIVDIDDVDNLNFAPGESYVITSKFVFLETSDTVKVGYGTDEDMAKNNIVDTFILQNSDITTIDEGYKQYSQTLTIPADILSSLSLTDLSNVNPYLILEATDPLNNIVLKVEKIKVEHNPNIFEHKPLPNPILIKGVSTTTPNLSINPLAGLVPPTSAVIKDFYKDTASPTPDTTTWTTECEIDVTLPDNSPFRDPIDPTTPSSMLKITNTKGEILSSVTPCLITGSCTETVYMLPDRLQEGVNNLLVVLYQGSDIEVSIPITVNYVKPLVSALIKEPYIILGDEFKVNVELKSASVIDTSKPLSLFVGDNSSQEKVGEITLNPLPTGSTAKSMNMEFYIKDGSYSTSSTKDGNYFIEYMDVKYKIPHEIETINPKDLGKPISISDKTFAGDPALFGLTDQLDIDMELKFHNNENVLHDKSTKSTLALVRGLSDLITYPIDPMQDLIEGPTTCSLLMPGPNTLDVYIDVYNSGHRFKVGTVSINSCYEELNAFVKLDPSGDDRIIRKSDQLFDVMISSTRGLLVGDSFEVFLEHPGHSYKLGDVFVLPSNVGSKTEYRLSRNLPNDIPIDASKYPMLATYSLRIKHNLKEGFVKEFPITDVHFKPEFECIDPVVEVKDTPFTVDASGMIVFPEGGAQKPLNNFTLKLPQEMGRVSGTTFEATLTGYMNYTSQILQIVPVGTDVGTDEKTFDITLQKMFEGSIIIMKSTIRYPDGRVNVKTHKLVYSNKQFAILEALDDHIILKENHPIAYKFTCRHLNYGDKCVFHIGDVFVGSYIITSTSPYYQMQLDCIVMGYTMVDSNLKRGDGYYHHTGSGAWDLKIPFFMDDIKKGHNVLKMKIESSHEANRIETSTNVWVGPRAGYKPPTSIDLQDVSKDTNTIFNDGTLAANSLQPKFTVDLQADPKRNQNTKLELVWYKKELDDLGNIIEEKELVVSKSVETPTLADASTYTFDVNMDLIGDLNDIVDLALRISEEDQVADFPFKVHVNFSQELKVEFESGVPLILNEPNAYTGIINTLKHTVDGDTYHYLIGDTKATAFDWQSVRATHGMISGGSEKKVKQQVMIPTQNFALSTGKYKLFVDKLSMDGTLYDCSAVVENVIVLSKPDFVLPKNIRMSDSDKKAKEATDKASDLYSTSSRPSILMDVAAWPIRDDILCEIWIADEDGNELSDRKALDASSHDALSLTIKSDLGFEQNLKFVVGIGDVTVDVGKVIHMSLPQAVDECMVNSKYMFDNNFDGLKNYLPTQSGSNTFIVLDKLRYFKSNEYSMKVVVGDANKVSIYNGPVKDDMFKDNTLTTGGYDIFLPIDPAAVPSLTDSLGADKVHVELKHANPLLSLSWDLDVIKYNTIPDMTSITLKNGTTPTESIASIANKYSNRMEFDPVIPFDDKLVGAKIHIDVLSRYSAAGNKVSSPSHLSDEYVLGDNKKPLPSPGGVTPPSTKSTGGSKSARRRAKRAAAAAATAASSTTPMIFDNVDISASTFPLPGVYEIISTFHDANNVKSPTDVTENLQIIDDGVKLSLLKPTLNHILKYDFLTVNPIVKDRYDVNTAKPELIIDIPLDAYRSNKPTLLEVLSEDASGSTVCVYKTTITSFESAQITVSEDEFLSEFIEGENKLTLSLTILSEGDKAESEYIVEYHKLLKPYLILLPLDGSEDNDDIKAKSDDTLYPNTKLCHLEVGLLEDIVRYDESSQVYIIDDKDVVVTDKVDVTKDASKQTLLLKQELKEGLNNLKVIIINGPDEVETEIKVFYQAVVKAPVLKLNPPVSVDLIVSDKDSNVQPPIVQDALYSTTHQPTLNVELGKDTKVVVGSYLVVRDLKGVPISDNIDIKNPGTAQFVEVPLHNIPLEDNNMQVFIVTPSGEEESIDVEVIIQVHKTPIKPAVVKNLMPPKNMKVVNTAIIQPTILNTLATDNRHVELEVMMDGDPLLSTDSYDLVIVNSKGNPVSPVVHGVQADSPYHLTLNRDLIGYKEELTARVYKDGLMAGRSFNILYEGKVTGLLGGFIALTSNRDVEGRHLNIYLLEDQFTMIFPPDPARKGHDMVVAIYKDKNVVSDAILVPAGVSHLEIQKPTTIFTPLNNGENNFTVRITDMVTGVMQNEDVIIEYHEDEGRPNILPVQGVKIVSDITIITNQYADYIVTRDSDVEVEVEVPGDVRRQAKSKLKLNIGIKTVAEIAIDRNPKTLRLIIPQSAIVANDFILNTYIDSLPSISPKVPLRIEVIDGLKTPLIVPDPTVSIENFDSTKFVKTSKYDHSTLLMTTDSNSVHVILDDDMSRGRGTITLVDIDTHEDLSKPIAVTSKAADISLPIVLPEGVKHNLGFKVVDKHKFEHEFNIDYNAVKLPTIGDLDEFNCIVMNTRRGLEAFKSTSDEYIIDRPIISRYNLRIDNSIFKGVDGFIYLVENNGNVYKRAIINDSRVEHTYVGLDEFFRQGKQLIKVIASYSDDHKETTIGTMDVQTSMDLEFTYEEMLTDYQEVNVFLFDNFDPDHMVSPTFRHGNMYHIDTINEFKLVSDGDTLQHVLIDESGNETILYEKIMEYSDITNRPTSMDDIPNLMETKASFTIPTSVDVSNGKQYKFVTRLDAVDSHDSCEHTLYIAFSNSGIVVTSFKKLV